MRHLVNIVIIINLICSGKVCFASEPCKAGVVEFTGTQLGPIYFLYPVPSKIAMLERIDLSFYKSSLIKSYRYRLETPQGSGLVISENLTEWSDWTTNELSRILIPRLDVEGRYRLIIEYKTSSGSDTKKFEKVFFVYSAPATSAVAASSRTRPGAGSASPRTIPSSVRTAVQTPPVADRTPTTAIVSTERTQSQAKAAIGRSTAEPSGPTNREQVQTPPVDDRTQTTTVTTERVQGQTLAPVNIATADTSKPGDTTQVKKNHFAFRSSTIIPGTTDRITGLMKLREGKTTTLAETSSAGIADTTPAEMKMRALSADSASEISNNQIADFIRLENPLKNEIVTGRISIPGPAPEETADSLVTPALKGEMGGFELLAVNELTQDITRNDSTDEADGNAAIDRVEPEFESFTADISPALAFQFKDLTAETYRNLIPYNDGVLSLREILPDFSVDDKSEALSDSSFTNIEGYSDHQVPDPSAGFDIMPDQKTSIEPLVPTDRYGNSPVHLAVLSDDIELLNSLIDKGADLNVKNTLELSPVHLAAISGNTPLVQNLVSKGADINIRGNSGYTPLHIAAEINDVRMTGYLLSAGANKSIRTDQKLTSTEIARIQGNDEILKLLRQKDSIVSVTLFVPGQEGISIFNPVYQAHKLDFNLPFDNVLVKKRRFNKIVQLAAIPVFALSAFESFHFKAKADRYYNLSKTAETEEMAKYYYDKTTGYDRNIYLAGGISLISVYSYIHSAIRKKNITRKIRKTFY